MKYKIGDRVRIKSIDWYNTHCDDAGNVDCGCEIFEKDMKPYLGKVFTIHRIVDNSKYEMEEAFDFFLFTNEMIECKVEDTITTNEQLFELSNISLEKEMEWNLPEGYIFKDENGNVINATKIVLEKKKPYTGYPKTYEECCQYLGCDDKIPLKIIGEFTKLINARNAYWKIAGEEMGLNRPWEPDWNIRGYYAIARSYGNVVKTSNYNCDLTFVFPTAEMRDAFYEAFKEEIEICKELL